MKRPVCLTKVIGLGTFGEKMISYLDQNPIRSAQTLQALSYNAHNKSQRQNQEAELNEVVYFIAHVSELSDLTAFSTYVGSYANVPVYKIVVLVLPADEVNTKQVRAKLLQVKEHTNNVITITRNSQESEKAVYEILNCLNAIIAGDPMEVFVDFYDLQTVLENTVAMVGVAETRGPDRALNATRQALSAPFIPNIIGTDRILLSIVSGHEAELEMDELTAITDYIQEAAGEQAEVIFGHGIETALADKIRVVVMAPLPDFMPAMV